MENVEELYKKALDGFFNLLSKNEDYLKTRHLINHTTGNVDPEILEKFEKLHDHFEAEYKIFNETHSKLTEYLKTTLTKSVTLSLKEGSAQEGNYQISLDPSNNLMVKRL
jgi:pyruvate-formate lyase-activating enzyme